MMKTMRSAAAAVAAGLVMLMIGCSAQPVPEGDDLYRDGEKRYLAMATTMHDIIMGIHEGDWEIPIGGHGAFPISCSRGLADGYRFAYDRTLHMSDIDAQAVSDRAVNAFEEAGVEPVTSIYGEGGARPQWNVIADDGVVGRIVVQIHPTEGWVGASVDTPCEPGDADALSAMVGDDENRGDDVLTWRSLPAVEGVDSRPQFYFPAGGPVYFNEDESPVEPQPVVTDPPKAPYGG